MFSFRVVFQYLLYCVYPRSGWSRVWGIYVSGVKI